MFKEGVIFLFWGAALFCVVSPIPMREGLDFYAPVFTSILFLGIWKSRWRATMRSMVFLLATAFFFLCLPLDFRFWMLWGGAAWFPDGGHLVGKLLCILIAGISILLACYNFFFLMHRRIMVSGDFWYWAMWFAGTAYFVCSCFIAEASFVTFFLYALPCALVERRRSVIYFSNIWTLVALMVAPVIIWKISGRIHDSHYFEQANQMFFGSFGEILKENLWIRSLLLFPWILMICVHAKNTLLNKNILHVKKA